MDFNSPDFQDIQEYFDKTQNVYDKFLFSSCLIKMDYCDNIKFAILIAPVAQLDRASDFGSEGWGFESSRAHHINYLY